MRLRRVMVWIAVSFLCLFSLSCIRKPKASGAAPQEIERQANASVEMTLDGHTGPQYVKRMRHIYKSLLVRYTQTQNGEFSFEEFRPVLMRYLALLGEKIDSVSQGNPLFSLPANFRSKNFLDQRRLEFLNWRLNLRDPQLECMKEHFRRIKKFTGELTYTRFWEDVRDIAFAMNGCFEHPLTTMMKSTAGGFENHIKDPKGKFLLPATEVYVSIELFNKLRALPLYFMGLGDDLTITDFVGMDVQSFFYHDWMHSAQMIANDARSFDSFLRSSMQSGHVNLDRWMEGRMGFLACVLNTGLSQIDSESRHLGLFFLFHEQSRTFTKREFEVLAGNPFQNGYVNTVYLLSGLKNLSPDLINTVIRHGAQCEDPSANM